MFRKKRAYLLCVCSIVLIFCILFSGCSLHVHKYSERLKFDENEHWKECECGQKSEIGSHYVTSWIIDEKATTNSKGLRHGLCNACTKYISEEIPMLDHEHDYSGEYLFNDAEHYKKCALCEETDFRQTHVVDSENWIIDIPAENDKEGLKHGTCNVCKNVFEVIIPAINHSHDYSKNYFYDNESHWNECACGQKINVLAHSLRWIIDTPATTESEGSKHQECSVCKKQFGSQVIDKLTGETRTVDFYSINDFHGSTDKISTVGGYLKQQKNNNPNTLLINSGDMFQGSMESNSNYGKLLTDCMGVVGFDAFTYGNHEFDWGLEKLESLAQNSSVPFLGANIYHWNASNRQWGTFASELAQEYTVKVLDNGVKVGIIGVIGEKQITSISSNLVQTIGFKDPLPIIKELAVELRNEQNCDVVVVSAHASPRGLVGESEGNNDPQEPSSAHDLEQYVDAVFCAHTHQEQNFMVDGLPFIQGGSYGSNVSHITLTVNSNGNVSCQTQENIPYSKSWPNYLDIKELVDNSNDKIKEESNQIVTTLNSSLNANPAMARLVSRAIAEYAANQGYDISLAMVNTARKTLSRGNVTYSDLYESIPFDNVVYIAKVKGSDIINEVRYGNYYWRSSGEAIESNKWYTIAVIDYLLYHQNDNRVYNYFPSAFTSGFTPQELKNDNYDVYNYRLITRDYLLANKIDASDYLYDNNNTDTSLLQSTVTLTYETNGTWSDTEGGDSGGDNVGGDDPDKITHAGTLEDPYTISEVIDLANTATSSTGSPKGYVKGVISDLSNLSRGSASDDLGRIYIKDIETGVSIYVYYITKFEGATKGDNWKWADDSSATLADGELKVGDEVILYAKSMYVFSGNPQIGSGFCISINGELTK